MLAYFSTLEKKQPDLPGIKVKINLSSCKRRPSLLVLKDSLKYLRSLSFRTSFASDGMNFGQGFRFKHDTLEKAVMCRKKIKGLATLFLVRRDKYHPRNCNGDAPSKTN
jgi:hypothetical protein